MKKTKLGRCLALALVLVMAVSMLQVSALAAGADAILGPAKTGDTRPVMLWIILMAVSAVAIIVLLVFMWIKRYKPKYYDKNKPKDGKKSRR